MSAQRVAATEPGAPPVGGDKPRLTAKDLLASAVVGIWADRADIGESPAWARRMREGSQERPPA